MGPISAVAEATCSDGGAAAGGFTGVPTATATAVASASGIGGSATFCDLPTATVFSGGSRGGAESGAEEGAPVAVAMPHRSSILPGSGDRNLLPLHGVVAGGAGVTYTDEWGNPILNPREDVTCAQLGCLFSCIPLVGWLTMYFNSTAPLGSRRR